MDLSIFSFCNAGQIRHAVLFFSFLISMQEIRECNSCAQDLPAKNRQGFHWMSFAVIWQPDVLQMSCIFILIRGRNGENNRLATGITPPPPPRWRFALAFHASRIPLPFPLLAPATQASRSLVFYFMTGVFANQFKFVTLCDNHNYAHALAP